MTYIILDPGHGGSDPGAVNGNFIEKKIVWTIATACGTFLKNEAGFKVAYTHDGNGASLAERTNFINAEKPDFALSVHANAGGGDGYESYPKSDTVSQTIADRIESYVKKETGQNSRGEDKVANFHMLRESNVPTILNEAFFVDNVKDRTDFDTSAELIELGQAYALGIISYFGKDIQPEPEKTLYKVQVGAYSKKANAEAMETKLKEKGFTTYIVEENGLYKVQTGAYSVKANAEAQASQLEKLGFDTYIKS